MSKRSCSSRGSNPITCWSVRHWALTPRGMPCPQAKKTRGTFRPLERGLEDNGTPGGLWLLVVVSGQVPDPCEHGLGGDVEEKGDAVHGHTTEVPQHGVNLRREG